MKWFQIFFSLEIIHLNEILPMWSSWALTEGKGLLSLAEMKAQLPFWPSLATTMVEALQPKGGGHLNSILSIGHLGVGSQCFPVMITWNGYCPEAFCLSRFPIFLVLRLERTGFCLSFICECPLRFLFQVWDIKISR